MQNKIKKLTAILFAFIMAFNSAVIGINATGNTLTSNQYEYTDSEKTKVKFREDEYTVIDDTITVETIVYELIDDKAELLAIKDALGKNYILMSDMDLSADTYSDAIIRGEFKGIFDGNGKKISGVKFDITNLPAGRASAGFFQILAGTAVVKNFTLDITFSGSVSPTKNCNLGGIAGAVQTSSDVKIQNITVNIDADIESKNAGNVMTVSGIIGATLSKLSITDCTVNGSIRLVSVSKWAYACGFIYYVNQAAADLTIKNCTNNADIYVRGNSTDTDVTCAAGIMGIMQDNGKVVIENCKNTGDIDSYYRAAGIIGIARKKEGFFEAFKMSGCSNTGKISVVHTDKKVYNLASYGFDDTQGRAGAVRVASVLDFTLLQSNEAKYYALTNDIDLGGAYDAATILSGFTNGVIDFCGYSLLNSKTEYTGNAANIIQPSVIKVMTPIPKAYQTTDLTADTYDIRIIASMGDFSGLKEIGFDIVVNGGEKITVNCWELNTKIVSNYGSDPEAASVYGGTYVICPVIEGLKKSDGAVNVEVTAWVKTSAGKEIRDTAKSFIFTPQ